MIPSFEELLAQAKNLTESNADVQAANQTNSLMAGGISNFVNTLLNTPTGEQNSYVGQVNPKGEYQNFQRPLQTGQTFGQQGINKLLGNTQPEVSPGFFPVTQKQLAEKALPQFLKMNTAKKDSDTESAIGTGFISEDFAKTIAPEYANDTQKLYAMSRGEAKQRAGFEKAGIYAGANLQKQRTLNLDEYATAATKTLGAMNDVERATRELGDFKRGVLGQLIAKGEIKVKELAASPEYVNYMGTIQQNLIPAARNLMEEKGPITEFDVQRVEEGLGKPSLPLEDKLKLIEQLRQKVVRGLNMKRSIAGINENDFKNKYPEVYNLLPKKNTGTEQNKSGGKQIKLPDGSLATVE